MQLEYFNYNYSYLTALYGLTVNSTVKSTVNKTV